MLCFYLIRYITFASAVHGGIQGPAGADADHHCRHHDNALEGVRGQPRVGAWTETLVERLEHMYAGRR